MAKVTQSDKPVNLPHKADLLPRLQDDSCPEYMLKAEECLRQEEERVAKYLHVDSKPKLLKEVCVNQHPHIGGDLG